MTTLVESTHFMLEHDPDCACLYATWRGHHHVASTHKDYESILNFVRSTRSEKLLNDGLLDQDGWRALTNWLAKDCFQRLAHEGVAAVAWVLPRDTQALHDTNQLVALLERPLLATFDDSEAAYNWLHQWPRLGKARGLQK